MADASVAPKSFLLTSELAEYLVGHGSPPDAVQLALIEETRALGAVVGHADRARAGRVPHAADPDRRRAVRGRGRHVHRLLGAVHRPRPRRRRPAAVLRRVRGVDGDRRGARGSAAGVADRIELRIAPGADTLRALPAGRDDRPRVHRRRQAELRRLLRGAARPAAPERRDARRQRALGRPRRASPTPTTRTPWRSGRSTTWSPPTTASRP